MSWCWLGIHKWGPWRQGRRKTWYDDNPSFTWYSACQARNCQICNKQQIKEI